MDDKEKIFLSILESHKGIIFKIANTYCNNPSDRDDLIQEIVIQIWLSLEHFNHKYKWSTWIYRVALNTSISFYRKNKIRKEKTTNLSPVIEMEIREEDHSKNEHFDLLRQFISELKEFDSAIILLHLEGLTSQEIADITHISLTNVTTKISRIKKKLRLRFKHHKS